MSTREKRRDDVERNVAGGNPSPTPARSRTGSVRSDARGLLDAARKLISETISDKSDEFLKAARQQGGE